MFQHQFPSKNDGKINGDTIFLILLCTSMKTCKIKVRRNIYKIIKVQIVFFMYIINLNTSNSLPIAPSTKFFSRKLKCNSFLCSPKFTVLFDFTEEINDTVFICLHTSKLISCINTHLSTNDSRSFLRYIH